MISTARGTLAIHSRAGPHTAVSVSVASATSTSNIRTAPTLRGRVAEALGALAQTSFDLAHDRYAQKAQALQNAAKAHVRNLTEEVLAAGEGAIAAMLSALVGKLKPDADERRPKP